MKKHLMLGMVIVMAFLAVIFVVQEKVYSLTGQKPKTIKGEVIDVSCYVSHGAKGEGHKDCAVSCLKAGQPGGILEDGTGKVYIAAEETEHMTNPNSKLIPYAAKKVEVRGIVHKKGGVATIDIKDIKEIGKKGSRQERKGSY